MHDIHELINKYFDGTTDEAQERELRDMLLTGDYSGDDVDEALAVMGYWAMGRREIRPRHRRRVPWAAAACAALAISAGVWVLYALHDTGSGESVAYVNGTEYHGDRATDMMDSQLMLLSVAAEQVEETINADLSVFSSLVE